MSEKIDHSSFLNYPQMLQKNILYLNYLNNFVDKLILAHNNLHTFIITFKSMKEQQRKVYPLTEQDGQVQFDRPKSVKQHNLELTKLYIQQSLFSIFAFIVMLIMFIICTVMTYQQNQHSTQKYSISQFNPKVLIKLGANAGYLIKQGQIYRLLTPIFLHAGIQHFFVNSISLLGLFLTSGLRYKKFFFVFTFLMAGMQGNLASLYANYIKQNENVVAIGASTSLCAIMGLNLASMYILSLKNGTVQNAKKQITFSVTYIFLSSMMKGIDFYGHMGSMIGGILIGLSFSCLKDNVGQETSSLIKMKQLCFFLYLSYSILLLTIFLI